MMPARSRFVAATVGLATAIGLATAGRLPAQGLQMTSPEDVGMSSERLARLTATLQQYVDDDRMAGAVALVARRGRIAYLEAVGSLDKAAGTPMPEDAIFRIASQTKAIVSVAIMMLQEEGKLLIQDPVGDYLPEYAETSVAQPREGGGYDAVRAHRPITIRDLLTHTSGVDYGDGPAADRWAEAGIQGWYLADRDEPIRETVRRMAALPFAEHPGVRFIYGYSIDILGAVVEVASGMPLDQFLSEKIFAPLGMTNTFFYAPDEKASRLATVYSSTEGGIAAAPDPGGMVGQGLYVAGPRKCFSGGAGLLSTAHDYAVFLQTMLNGGVFDGRRILSRKSVELMTVDHLGTITFPWEMGVGFGLGFEIVKDLGSYGQTSSVGQFSWGGAYHSTYWVDPVEELVVVYFTQLIPATNIDDHGKLRALIYQAIID